MRMQRLVLTLALLLGVCLSLVAVPAQAQTEPAGVDNPNYSSFGVRCADGHCTLSADLGDIEADVPVPAGAPLTFDLPMGNLGFLGGASIEISDTLTLKLPFGEIQIPDGDFSVRLNEVGKVERLHGAAKSVMPNLNLPNDMRVGGPFAAEFGYDFGSELGSLSHLLDPEQHYLFLRVGDGFTFDTAVTDENGRSEPITLAVPEHESTTLVIDPENQELYLDGRFNISQVLQLAAFGGMIGIDVEQLPLLAGLGLPMHSTIGAAVLLSRQPGRSFVELNGDVGITGGPLGKMLGLKDAPLTLDSSLRIDRSGMKLQGAADAKLMPTTLLEGGGTVELFVPFQQLSDAYIRIGGDLAVPVVGIVAEGETQLGGAQLEGDGGPSWWDAAAGWIGGAASSTASGVAGGAQAGLDAVQSAADVAGKGLGAAGGAAVTSSAADAAGSALSGATSGVTCGVNKAQQLWCQTTGLCEAPADACAAPAEEGK